MTKKTRGRKEKYVDTKRMLFGGYFKVIEVNPATENSSKQILCKGEDRHVDY